MELHATRAIIRTKSSLVFIRFKIYLVLSEIHCVLMPPKSWKNGVKFEQKLSTLSESTNFAADLPIFIMLIFCTEKLTSTARLPVGLCSAGGLLRSRVS